MPTGISTTLLAAGAVWLPVNEAVAAALASAAALNQMLVWVASFSTTEADDGLG